MRSKIGSPQFVVDQVVGSFSLEGIRFSSEQRQELLDIASGKLDHEQVRQRLLAKYRSPTKTPASKR